VGGGPAGPPDVLVDLVSKSAPVILEDDVVAGDVLSEEVGEVLVLVGLVLEGLVLVSLVLEGLVLASLVLEGLRLLDVAVEHVPDIMSTAGWTKGEEQVPWMQDFAFEENWLHVHAHLKSSKGQEHFKNDEAMHACAQMGRLPAAVVGSAARATQLKRSEMSEISERNVNALDGS